MEEKEVCNVHVKMQELDFSRMNAVRKQCIGFAKNGNNVERKYKLLYGVYELAQEEICRNLYIESVKESVEQCCLYLWEDMGELCRCIGRNIPQDWSMAKFLENVKKWEYWGKEGFLKSLEVSEQNSYYINKVDIELCRYLGEEVLAEHYADYRSRYIRNRDEKAAKECAEKEQREKEQEEKERVRIEAMVKLAEAAIRKHEPFDNEQIDGNTVVLHLMKKYCINVPLRTQGWINNALAKIVFHEDKISYMYYSSSKNSTVFRQYLQELAEVIECNNAEGVSSAMN